MRENKQNGENVKISSPLLKKLDNYWYHYKWHTIVALVLVIAILVCTLQMCNKQDYDLEVVYGGPQDFLTNGQAKLDIEDAFAAVIDDENGDGKRQVNFYTYWVDNSLFEEGADDSGSLGVLINNSNSNMDALHQDLVAGNVMIFFLSSSIFFEYAEKDAFIPLTEICPEIDPYTSSICPEDEKGRLDTTGILLSATSFGKLAGLSSMPADTVLCMRTVAPLQTLPLNRNKALKEYNYCTEYMRRILENEIAHLEE